MTHDRHPTPTEAAGHVATIRLIRAPSCPHCAIVLRELQRLIDTDSSATLSVHDVAEVPDLVERFAIRSVPTTLLDDCVALRGSVTAERVLALLGARASPEFDAERLRTLIESGRFSDASRFIAEESHVGALRGLLAGSDLSTRMGITLVVQGATETLGAAALSHVVPELLGLLASGSTSLRGDVIDLLASIGDARAVEPIRALLADPDPQLVEAAADALERFPGAPSPHPSTAAAI